MAIAANPEGAARAIAPHTAVARALDKDTAVDAVNSLASDFWTDVDTVGATVVGGIRTVEDASMLPFTYLEGEYHVLVGAPVPWDDSTLEEKGAEVGDQAVDALTVGSMVLGPGEVAEGLTLLTGTTRTAGTATKLSGAVSVVEDAGSVSLAGGSKAPPPGAAVMKFRPNDAGNHVSIEVRDAAGASLGEWHQTIGGNTTAVKPVGPKTAPAVREISVPLPNPQGSVDQAKFLMEWGDLGPWDIDNNSCIHRVADIAIAGGAKMPAGRPGRTSWMYQKLITPR